MHFQVVPGSDGGLITWPQLLMPTTPNAGSSNDIITMEDDDDNSDDDGASASVVQGAAAIIGEEIPDVSSPGQPMSPTTTSATASSSPFDDLRDLLCHNAHLTVFVNFVLSNLQEPAPLVRGGQFRVLLLSLSLFFAPRRRICYVGSD